jgi:triacylglycerol lipase
LLLKSATALAALIPVGCAQTAASSKTALADQIRATGPVIDFAGAAALYAPLQEREPYRDLKVARDILYGPDARNLCDVFKPRGARNLPVIIFVHGGGFVAGERRMSPTSPFYDNVAVWAARHGFVGVNITYRLAPQAPWPAGAIDVGTAVAWTRDAIRDHGGDGGRICLLGHSAGATHVASYLSHPQFYRDGDTQIRGAVCLSGTFEPTQAPLPDEVAFVRREQAYFGTDAAVFASQSSAPGLIRSRVPLLIANAELDPPYFLRRGAALKAAFEAAGRRASFATFHGQSHASEVMSINSSDRTVAGVIDDFLRAWL